MEIETSMMGMGLLHLCSSVGQASCLKSELIETFFLVQRLLVATLKPSNVTHGSEVDAFKDRECPGSAEFRALLHRISLMYQQYRTKMRHRR